MQMCIVSSAGTVVGCFFLKQKTAYEMRISDWSSDVCSSDLLALLLARAGAPVLIHGVMVDPGRVTTAEILHEMGYPVSRNAQQIGIASCRERVCQYE